MQDRKGIFLHLPAGEVILAVDPIPEKVSRDHRQEVRVRVEGTDRDDVYGRSRGGSRLEDGYILANPEVRYSTPRSPLRQCSKGFFPFRSNFLTSESPPEPRLLGLRTSHFKSVE